MSLLLTRTQNIRTPGNIDKWEIRASRYGALDMYMRMTDSPTGIITEDLKQKAGISIGSTLEVPVIDDNTSLTIGSTREAIIVDAENTSRMIVIPFTTFAHGFTQVPANFHNNEIDMQRDFETKMKLTDRLFATAINAQCDAHLETNKSKVFGDTLLFTELADTIIATFDQREEILGDTNVIMNSNDFFGELHIVGNAGFESLVRKLAEKDLFNTVNKSFQYNDKIWYWDHAIPKGVGKFADGFVVQEDSLGIMWRHEREALTNQTSRTGHEWGISTLPMSMIPVSTYFYESVDDFSALTGAASADMTRVKKQHFGFAIDVALQAAYISDTANRATPIMKIQVNRAETDTDVTAPDVDSLISADLLAVTVVFTEVVCTDQAGTIITGDLAGLFSITGTGTITTAIAAVDGLSIVFTIAAAVNTDTLEIGANKLFDGAGNAFVAATLATATGGVWV